MNLARNLAEAEPAKRLIASPYLQELNPLDLFLGRLLDRGIRGLSPRLIADRGNHLIFDYVSSRVVSVSDTERALLKRLRVQGAFALDALAEADLATGYKLLEKNLLIDEQQALTMHQYDRMPIEINSHCNYRCEFCPVSKDPLPKQTMPMDTYRLMIDRAKEAGIGHITLNHFGEPTLDRDLVERVRIAKESGIKVDLFTNASRLDEDRAKSLAELGNAHLTINLPDVDAERYRKVTGSMLLKRVISNIRKAADAGLPMHVSINAPREGTMWDNFKLKHAMREQLNVPVTVNRSLISRAGEMTNSDYAPSVFHSGRLGGCVRMLTKFPVDVDGKAFICAQDYKKEYILGDLKTSSVREIAEGPVAMQMRRWVFGLEEAPEDFICRRCEETAPLDESIDIGKLLPSSDHRWSFRGLVHRLKLAGSLRRRILD